MTARVPIASRRYAQVLDGGLTAMTKLAKRSSLMLAPGLSAAIASTTEVLNEVIGLLTASP
jgi:hypothetical protein